MDGDQNRSDIRSSGMQQSWQQVMSHLQGKTRRVDFRNWFQPLVPTRLSQGTLTLQVKDREFQTWFVEHHEPLLVEALEQVLGKPTSVDYKILNPELFDHSRPSKPPVNPFSTQYTFDNFVVGPSNHMAYAAGRAAGEKPGGAYNPLFIYGGTGLGKTHLLNAMGQLACRHHPHLRVLYITAETYFNDLMVAIRVKNMEHFRVKYRDACDMLLVDDVQFFAGKPRTQEEFFHTFNALHAAGKQIAFTSDRFPQEIPEIEDRLKSRFEWGLIADINTPELETRVAILKAKAEMMELDLSDELALLLAQKIRDNIRELESCLKTLHLASETSGEPLSPKMAQERLKAYFRNQARRVTIEQIQKTVAGKFGVTEAELRSKSRKKNITFPRHVAMYLCRELTYASFPEIGDKFGGRDHTSVMSAHRNMKKRVHIEPAFNQLVEDLQQKLRR